MAKTISPSILRNSFDRRSVVVGALHLVGKVGVVRLLANQGYRVERVH